MYQATKYRCCHCKPERSELTGSEYYAWLWNLQDHLTERYDLLTEDGKDELYSELDNMKDELQSRLDNMPEQLQYSETGELLQDRIDSIESAQSELDDVEYPDEDDYVVTDEDKEGLDEDDIETMKDEKETEYKDALDDCETTITDAINNIE